MNSGTTLPDPTLLDAALRGALIATLSILGTALAREPRPTPAAVRIALALLAGLLVQTVASAPALERGMPLLWQAPLVGLSVGNSVLFWLFARSLFDDDFRLWPRHVGLWMAVVVVGTSSLVSTALAGPEAPVSRALRLLLRWLPACFACFVVVAAAWQWRGDLVERRRRLRSFIVFAGTAYTGAMVVLRLAAPHGMLSPTEAGIDSAVLLAIVLVSAVTSLRVTDTGGLLVATGRPAAGPAAVSQGDTSGNGNGNGNGDGDRNGDARLSSTLDTRPVPAALPPPAVLPISFASRTDAGRSPAMPSAGPDLGLPPDPKQSQLADALDVLMREQRVYRIDDLTLGLLAIKLGAPEYRLRRCIHERLGYRNFSAYINSQRLVEAREALADPARRTTPVTEIAMSAGFASIGPFNRAFKAETGLTPSEFRLRAMADC